MEQTTLYYRQGTSDKVYQAAIEPRDEKYVVTFAYGRRGSTLVIGMKTPAAVDYGAAKAIYDKLVKEKMAKGYTPGEEGTPYQQTEKQSQSTGICCQLLNPADEEQVSRLISDSDWCMQEKHDGRRLLIRKDEDGEVSGINRKGLVVSLPVSLIQAAQQIEPSFVIDGEAIGDQLIAFDVLEIGGNDVREWSCKKRLFALGQILIGVDARHISRIHSVTSTQDKLTLLERLKHHRKEGVVFKRLASAYVGGRPASGGDQLKFKFCESATYVVSRVNVTRSVGLILFDGDKVKSAGNVTIPPNHEVPPIGAVVEVRYLYAFRESGHIYQPVFLGVRDDIASEECTVDQLKRRADAAQPQEELAA
jgi:bifunctional non-homologous end joining protein LigD